MTDRHQSKTYFFAFLGSEKKKKPKMLRIKNLNSLLYISLRPCFRAYSQQLEAAEPKFEEGELHHCRKNGSFSYLKKFVFIEEFRVLNFKKVKSQPVQRRRQKMPEVSPPRSKQMAIDQDWGAVWPAPRTFHPATVPLPLRQGYTKKNKAPPGKFANAELMKIPNFLHLTPPVIAKQCEALKKFCTPWPKGLETTENQEQHYPVQYMSSDYVHGSPSIRNPFSRIVTIKLKLKELNLDQHAQDKFLRLVGERYNSDTDELTIVTDRCPLRKQNYDYAIYLLTGN